MAIVSTKMHIFEVGNGVYAPDAKDYSLKNINLNNTFLWNR